MSLGALVAAALLALLFGVAGTAGSQAQSSWHIETVDGRSYSGTSTSLALDNTGQPHIIASRLVEHVLYYTYRDGAGWQHEVVDSYGGTSTALVLDTMDRPQVAYQSGGLRYAWKSTSGWLTETVDSTTQAGEFVSLALASDGYPHLAYSSGADFSRLNYAYLSSSGWHTETIDVLGGRSVSLKLDSTGHPHVAYQRDGLRYARRGDDGWLLGTVVEGNWTTGSGAALVLDSDDQPKISYNSMPVIVPGACGNLYFASMESSGWVTTTIDYCAGGTSLVAATSDQLHAAYRFGIIPEDTGLRLATRVDDIWSFETVESMEGEWCLGGHSSLAVDAAGTPCISYAGIECELKLACRETTTPVRLVALQTNAGSSNPAPARLAIAIGLAAAVALCVRRRAAAGRLCP